MSDADSFIQEVSDEVRSDRLFRLWRRYAPFVLAAVLAVVGAAAVDAYLRHSREQAARDAGGALIRATAPADPARRAGDLLAAADALDAGPALVARLRAAGELAAAGDAAGALRLYRAVAEDAGSDPIFAAFAALRAAETAAPEAGPAATIAALTPLAAEGQPFRLLALEARAAQRMAQGDRAGALADLDALLADPGVTEAQRQRAAEVAATLRPAPEAAR